MDGNGRRAPFVSAMTTGLINAVRNGTATPTRSGAPEALFERRLHA